MQPNTELLAPIPGANPAGVHLRYEPLYDQIKEARREEIDLPQGDWQTARKVADWPLVIRLTSDALSKKSKDLQLAAWLTEALLRRDGVAGLGQGLELLRDMVEQFWDTLYPEIDEGDAEIRAAPLEWVGMKLDDAVRHAPLNRDRHSLIDYRTSRTVPTKEEAEEDSGRQETREQAIADGKLTPEEFDDSFGATPKEWYRALVADGDAAAASLDALDESCRERFGDVAPSFLPLRGALTEVRQLGRQLFGRKLELEPDGEGANVSLTAAVAEAGPADAAIAPAATPAGGRVSGAVSLGTGPASREEAAAWIAAAAVALRRERPADPAAYLVLRGFRWGELRAHGGAIDPKALVAPSTETRSKLKELLLDGRWPELLDAAEAVMALPQGRGWLDLQRHVLTACDALGGEYDVVGRAVRGALRTLLADLPELPTLALMDDSPVANAETLAWLRDEGMLDGGPEPESLLPERRRPAARRDAYDVARELAAGGDTRNAMELLMREALQEKSARARFLRRAQAAEIMVQAGLEPVALPMLRELLTLVEAHRLEEWEAGETVAHPLGLLFRCLTRLDTDEGDRAELYDRICRLDPMQAVQLGETTGSADEGG
jgi:type VI secretion system protein ImpA